MSTLNDLDSAFIQSVSSLHSPEHILSGKPSAIQINLEEAIKNKTGVAKDFSALIASVTKNAADELKTIQIPTEESKTSSSDNDLELDLFNEDLMCIICSGMDVGAKNRLLECSGCHSLYHQECHRPPVTTSDSDGCWTCHNCKH